MRRPLFLPTARQTNWLLIVAFLAVGRSALHPLHGDRECEHRACLPGQVCRLWLCTAFRISGSASSTTKSLAGWRSALRFLNLIRPSIVLTALALAAAGFGIVLHNADLSALAVGVLILSLARPAPAPE